ncbi:MAG: hypothetical protein QM770_19645 [Tepidisphaeraceae bacterium]
MSQLDATNFSGNPADVPPTGAPTPPNAPKKSWQEREVKPGIVDRVEAFISRLSTRDTFWQRICSLIWLPLAFFSGIRVKQVGDAASKHFTAVLPFKRFNRNWYRAMAGGALLGNAEIAGGMYVFGACGDAYTVVCKNLNYTFLRPCMGPAVYKMTPREDLKALVASKKEFNVVLDMEIVQQSIRPNDRERRVGRAEVTFHVTPKVHHKRKRLRKEK